MNVIKHYHSLIALKDDYKEFSNKYLLYYDKDWKCWFFMNYKTNPDNNEKFIIEHLSNQLHIKKDKISLEYIAEEFQTKYSVKEEHNKTYAHRLYKCNILSFPREIQKDEFCIDGIDYKWMSIAEMESDERIKEINSDVVSLVKDNY